MSILIKAPDSIVHTARKSIFLAGTIDLGKSVDWQSCVAKELAEYDVAIFNPRREVWNNSIDPKDAESEFLKEQILWELNALDKADIIILWLAGSASPISLLEMGLFARSGKLIVGCDSSFYRYANVFWTCQHTGCTLVQDLNSVIELARMKLNDA